MLGEKAHNYFRYAVGELVLVVLGILIALQINNWNEERIEQQQIADYAHALTRDLERDLVMIGLIEAEINVLISKIDTLNDYVTNSPYEELKNIDLYYLMRAPFYRPYSWNRTALEQIKSSGALRQMKNQELAEKIAAYEAFANHLEGDFEFDRTVGISALQLAGTVIDMSYPNVYEKFGAKSPSSFSFPESPFHAAYKDTDLALLADSMEDIKLALNSYLILGGYYGIRPRAEGEIPRLVEDARELINLLKLEYPE